MMEYFIVPALGFVSSAIFYGATHKDGFPEVGRYALGIIGIAISMRSCRVSDRIINLFLKFALLYGAGVSLYRWFFE